MKHRIARELSTWELIYDGEGTKIYKNGKLLTNENDILSFIENDWRPEDLHLAKAPEAMGEEIKVTAAFHFLFTSKERIDCYVKSFASLTPLGRVIYKRVKERYPGLVS